MKSVEYVSDSGETEEESGEEEEEDKEQDSPPPPPEHWTKRRHEPAAPSAAPASSSALPTTPMVPSAPSTVPGVPSARSTDEGRRSRHLNSCYLCHLSAPKMIPWTWTMSSSQRSSWRFEFTLLHHELHLGLALFFRGLTPFGRVSLEAIYVDEVTGEGLAVPPILALAQTCRPTKAMSIKAAFGSSESGAGLGMPKEPPTMPGPSNIEYNVQRLPEDQVGAAKGHGAKTCEMGTAYETLGAEKVQFAGELDAALVAMADFCMDAEAEAADVERSIRENIPLGEDANQDLLRAHIRLGKVGPFIGRLREVVGRIDKELWPEDESRHEMEGLMTRLEEVPNRVRSWKKSAARCGADVALSLVRVHCKEVRKEKLKALQVTNTKKLWFEDFMETFLESATRITDGIDLDTFVEPASPSATPDDA
ncbi:hypothetical protein ZWY2020_038986 [Hordeum vulgare]|nr:hypothetical protein ZWY2020_038986 [Hordeum vulgare]